MGSYNPIYGVTLSMPSVLGQTGHATGVSDVPEGGTRWSSAPKR
jgi:hypothetical protein